MFRFCHDLSDKNVIIFVSYAVVVCAEYLVPLVTRYSFSHHDRSKVDILLRQMQIMSTNPITKTVAPAEGQVTIRDWSQFKHDDTILN